MFNEGTNDMALLMDLSSSLALFTSLATEVTGLADLSGLVLRPSIKETSIDGNGYQTVSLR